MATMLGHQNAWAALWALTNIHLGSLDHEKVILRGASQEGGDAEQAQQHCQTATTTINGPEELTN